MAHEPTTTSHAFNPPALPQVRKISKADLEDALAKGFSDFREKPSHVFFLGIIYPIVGLLLARLAFGYALLPILFPLVAGFALLGPLAAIGFYEISRRREQGLDTSWWQVFGLFRAKSIGAIVALGLLLMVLYVAWLSTANAIYHYYFGPKYPASFGEFFHQVFATPEGLMLILIGNAAGFLFALLIFSISVVSFPLLVDRDVSAPAAMVTSIRAVAANPLIMMGWAIFITLALIVGSLPFLLGLAIVLPVLGHASWHLYKKIVV